MRQTVVLFLIGTALWPSVSSAEDQTRPNEPPITADDRDHWSFRPLSQPAIPRVKQTEWTRNPIDSFILANLEAAGLEPMPQADRRTLIRRLSFDLRGLPPTPTEIQAFVDDESPQVYEALVKRLLTSKAYGERYAQHWLDLARFAETDGFEHDKVRPNAWRYRDWVIDALNRDLPFDEFVRLQIAGDELKPNDQWSTIATGFLLCGPDMPDINLQTERRHNFLNDMTSTVGSVLLGLQIGCAQCHDHKYDPISQYDFYRLRAFFDHEGLFKEHPIPTPEDGKRRELFQEERAKRWKQLETEIAQLEQAVLKRVRDERNDPKLQLRTKQLLSHFSPKKRQQHSRLTKELARVKKQRAPSIPLGRVMKERSAKAPMAYLQIRGDFRRRGPIVNAGFPRIVNPQNAKVAPPVDGATSSGRRTALAVWLTQPNHPLVTRVIVNRLWQNHFGYGLVRSPSDAGVIGEAPSHPELLDWLATRLPELGWSLKKMHQLMVTSATYRQASRYDCSAWSEEHRKTASRIWRKSTEVDPRNELFSRFNTKRLEGEAIRDAMLAVSSSLSTRSGGPGIRPPLPKEITVTLLKNQWPVSPNKEDHRRRSIYLFARRNLRFPILEAFDKPDQNVSCPRRNNSTTAPQALILLNSEFSLKSARRLAGFVINQVGMNSKRQVEFCYQRVLGRKPTIDEQKLATEFLIRSSSRLKQEDLDTAQLAIPIGIHDDVDLYQASALTSYCLTIFNLNEFIYVD